jgi:hypothetical protein
MEIARNFLSVPGRLTNDGKMEAVLQKKRSLGRARVAATNGILAMNTNGIFAMKLRNFYVFVNE